THSDAVGRRLHAAGRGRRGRCHDGSRAMKSIRRTLLFNMLLLLVVTLGVVSFFVYRTAEGALRQRQRTARELVEVRYADRQDEQLRNRADELAGEVQSNFNRDEFRKQWIASEVSALLPQAVPSFAPITVRS